MFDWIMHRKVILKRGKRKLLGHHHRARDPTLANASVNIDYPTLASGGFAWNLADGTPVIVRRARIQDESLMRNFQESLSEETVHLRYFDCVKLETRIRDDS